MPGYDGYNPYTSYGGYTGTTKPGTSGGYQHPGGSGSGNGGGNNQNNNVNTAIYKEMADTMSEVGQISGGLGGGTYTKGPVVYPKSFYTHEGLEEVQKKGWSDKLANYDIQGKTPSEWILSADNPADAGGGLQTLPEGILYSSNIGDPKTGYGGTIRTPSFVPPGNDNDGQSYNYGYGYDPGSGGGGGYSMVGVHPRSFYKGLAYQDFSGKEVQKMLAMNQKIDAANILSGLSQGAHGVGDIC